MTARAFIDGQIVCPSWRLNRADARFVLPSGSSAVTNESSTLADYLRVLRRRRWIVVLSCLLVTGAAVALTLRAPTSYEAEARVALDQGSLVDELNGSVPSVSSDQQAQQLAREAEVARSAAVRQRALARVSRFLGGSALKDVATVDVASDTGVLVFAAHRPSARDAAGIADGYAGAYLDYRRDLNQAQYQSAATRLEGDLASLRDRGRERGALYTSLQDQLDRVQAQQALVSSGASVLGTSEPQ